MHGKSISMINSLLEELKKLDGSKRNSPLKLTQRILCG